MITPNMHYRDLKESYLFAGIAQKVGFFKVSIVHIRCNHSIVSPS